MKDAAEEERLAGIKRLNEGDFGDDLPLVIRACGFTTLELPNFDAQELQTEEVVSLCANLVANPRSFDQWISLMKLVEAHGKDEDKRELYEHFLCEFPLCWGYWKRLADLQTRMGGAETGLNVYVKALKLAPACVDLWVHYCQTASVSWSSEDPEVEDGLRQIFEKAVETVGTDWRAFPLWDLYMNFEEKHGRWKRLGALLRRAMVIPMEGLPAVRIRLRALVVGDAAPALEELCCDDQEAELLDVEMKPPSDPQVFNVVLEDHLPKVENKNPEPKVVEKDEQDEKVVATAPILPVKEVEMEELEEGEICDDEGEVAPAAPASPVPPEDPPAPEEPKDSGTTKVEAMETTEPKKSKFITERTQRFLELREGLWAAASEEAARLRHFEAPLHRHYFHQKPLSSAQLDAWRRFLDFEESREPRDWRRLQVVFERCLIVTNNYLEFWLRYASWLQFAEAESGAATPEMACSLLRGACLSGRLSRRPDVFAAWAELEEACGRTGRARILLDATLSGCGHGSADVALRRAALELRHKDSELALVLLARYATDAVDLASKAVLSRRYAKLCEEMKQFEQAQRSLMLTWQAGCRDVGLLLELASLLMRMGTEEKGTDPSPLQQSCNLFEEALRCAQHDTASFTEACELWSCYVDFLLSHGAPLVQLRDVQARARAFRAKASVQISEKKKRGLQGPAFISAKQVKVDHGFEYNAQGGSMVK